MAKYLTFFDLDNTILTKRKQIKYSTIRGIRRLEKLGCCVCVATGRGFDGCINFYEKLKLTTPLVTTNGSEIYYKMGDGTFRHEVFPIDLDGFLHLIKELGYDLHSGKVYLGDEVLVYNLEDINNLFYPNSKPKSIRNGNLLYDCKSNPLFAYLRVRKEALSTLIAICNEVGINYVVWKDNGWLVDVELLSNDGTKGAALVYLAKQLKVDTTIAFGDQLNDISMIQLADYGVAMVNAKRAVKNTTPFHTYKDYEHNGAVSYAIKLVKELKKRES